jgi:hypothetical protein
MNVIASPDYGIKNIAGTNQEILAILSGVHNSKNNIHAIVDDIRSLLQKLVDTSTSKSKPIEIGNKSSKINHKNIQDILDETKGIRKAIDNLAKTLNKQGGKNMPAVAKLSNKASEKVAKAMIKDIEKQKKGGGMAALVDAFTKLKDISLKDIIFGKLKLNKISELFKDAKENLKIKEKDLNNIIKLINAAPEIMRALKKVGRRINTIIRNRVIKKLSEMLFGKKNSLLSLAKELQKNKKTFGNASKAAKSIEELSKSLCKVMARIIFAALFSKLATIGIGFITHMLDNLMQLSQALRKSKKDFDAGSKAAKNIRIFVGNLLVTSIFLTMSLITVLPAILGALCLRLLVDTLIPTGKKLSKNHKRMANAAGAALIFTAFTGLMLISSFFLTKIAENGVMPLLGSLIVLGVVSVSVITFKILNKAKKNVIIGAILMAIMSVSLLLFGIALGKITKATENVTWKQVAIIATTLVMLALATAVMGEPTTASFIMLGSITMSVLSIGLIIFGTALGKIASATKSLKFKQVALVAGSILALGLPVAGAGFLAGPVTLGSIALTALSLALRPFLKTLSKISKATENLKLEQIETVASSMMILGLAVVGMGVPPISLLIGMGAVALGTMGSALYTFVKSLKIISDMGKVPKKEIDDVIAVMKNVGTFFKKNALSFKAMRSARKYQQIMRPFGKAINHLVKLSKIGGKIPTPLIYQALNAMRAIGNFFVEHPIEKSVIKAARRYKRMIRPFGKTIGFLSTLKKMGSIPMKLVYQALNVMGTIADYFTNNPLKRKAIKNARKYKRMMRPFGKTIGFLSTLKKMGSIPMKLVYQALNVMGTISSYFLNNPLKRKAIKNARKYKRLMRPFGKTIGYLATLKKMGTVPMKLVYQALNAISAVVSFYRNQNMGKWKQRRKMRESARMITTIVASFGIAVNSLKTLKDLRRVPTEAIQGAITAIRDIAWFYRHTHVGGGNIEGKSKYFEYAVDKFTTMAKNIQDKFRGITEVNNRAIRSIARACRTILNFYTFTLFFAKPIRIARMNRAIKSFTKTALYLKKGIEKFTIRDIEKTKFALKAMKRVFRFLNWNSMSRRRAKAAWRTVSLISNMATAMLKISKIDSASITSVGDSLTSALSGVNAVDVGQVEAVTNMFNAFNGINKSENIINKFAESVKEFTATCKDLMNAMEHNTEAINGIETNNESSVSIFDRIKNKFNSFIGNDSYTTPATINTDTDNQTNGIRIINVEELANTIAAKINGAISVDVPDTQVQLTINGSGGNEWIISKY